MMTTEGRSCVALKRVMWGGVCLWLVIGALGCTTNRHYAAKLPTGLQAPPTEDLQTIDLSRLAMASGGSQLIDRGDVLDISISAGLRAEDTVRFPARVNERGLAHLPVVGEVPLAGLEPEGAEAAIVAACVQNGLYRAPHVTVTMKKQRTNRVTVVGAVEKPGIYELPRSASDLLAALVAAGSLAEDAGSEVEIRNSRSSLGEGDGSPRPPIADRDAEMVSRAGHTTEQAEDEATGDARPQTVLLNLVTATREGSGGYYIDDGAVVSVEKREPQPVHIMGLVRRPGRYEFPVSEDLRVLDAIALANGTVTQVADKVFVIRRLPGQPEPALIQVSLRKAKRNDAENLRLSPGDTVSIEHSPATVFVETIMLARFGLGTMLNLVF